MSKYRLDLSITEDTEPDNPKLPEPRSLVLVFTDDEIVMAAALRAAADMLDPKDPVAVRKRTERHAAGRRAGPRRQPAEDDDSEPFD